MSNDDWTGIYIEVPPGEAEAILRVLAGMQFQFDETDYCEMLKPDGSRVSWGPIGTPPGVAVAKELHAKATVQRVAYPSATDMEGARVDQERRDRDFAAGPQLLAQIWHDSHCALAPHRWVPKQHWYDCMNCDAAGGDGGNPHYAAANRALKTRADETRPAPPWVSDPRPGFGSEPPG